MLLAGHMSPLFLGAHRKTVINKIDGGGVLMKKSQVILLTLLIVGMIAMSCGVTKIVQRENLFDRMHVAVLQLAQQGQQRQTLDSVTVTLTPISMGADELVTIVRTRKPESGFCGFGDKVIVTEKLIPTLRDKGSLPIFKVDIHNDTDHVITIGGGTVIAYIPAGENPLNPAAGMGFSVNQQGAAGMGTMPPAMGRPDMNQNNPVTQESVEKQALAEAMQAFDRLPKLDAATRVLPNYNASGYVFFDYNLLRGASTGEFKIFDLVTKVDATGAPLKKATFSWSFKVEKGYATSIPGALGITASQFRSSDGLE